MQTKEMRDAAGWPKFEDCIALLNPHEQWAARMAMQVEKECWHDFDFYNNGRPPRHDYEMFGEAKWQDWKVNDIVEAGLRAIFASDEVANRIQIEMRKSVGGATDHCAKQRRGDIG